jgi:hypothetical protein
VRSAGMKFYAILALAASAVLIAGCSGLGAKKKEDTVVIDPNVYPQDYRQRIGLMLAQTSKDAADFHGTLISQPMLKPVGGESPHYVVCLQFTGHGQSHTKVAVFLEGAMTQFIDAKPEQCGDAQYQPFGELEGKKS